LYQILLTHRAKKDLLSFPEKHRLHISATLKRFAADPSRHHDVVKVRDSPRNTPRYRLRIGEYRATFFIHHDMLIIEIITIGKKENFSY
jgi:mRNA-degrading endonuclease RelE of RelBE toxin-antitoxin system